jgi:hypothetical protein
MNQKETKLKWKALEKRKDVHILGNRYIFIAKYENRLITELEVEGGNILLSGWGGVWYSKHYQHSGINPSTSESLPSNLTAHDHFKLRAKES